MIQFVYHRINQGIGITNMLSSTIPNALHRMANPVASKSKLTVPRTFRQSHCIIYFATQAQPTIVRKDRIRSTFHPT
jgi:hypothetical protein